MPKLTEEDDSDIIHQAKSDIDTQRNILDNWETVTNCKVPASILDINKREEAKQLNEDLLNATAEFYNPSEEELPKKETLKREEVTIYKNNEKSESPKNIEWKGKGKTTSRSNYNPYGPKLRIRSSSNKHKYQMYNPQNLRYK